GHAFRVAPRDAAAASPSPCRPRGGKPGSVREHHSRALPLRINSRRHARSAGGPRRARESGAWAEQETGQAGPVARRCASVTRMTHLPLITGSGGRLGRALCQVIEDEYAETFPGAVFATRDELDITDYWRLRAELERFAPTVVINCAAYAQVDGCETNRDAAELMNATGAGNVARAARAVDARIIQISTDLVFDGAAGRPYREDDDPAPLSHY